MSSRAFNPLPSKRLSSPFAVLVSLPLLLNARPSFLRAQFTDPTPDELKLTADPKAPGASAVYLYREEVTDGEKETRTTYERIKILTEKGMELATVHIPYEVKIDKITEVQGRTIHADGTIVPLTAKPDDLVDFKTKGLQIDTKVFTLPSVEVGSILEYRVRIHTEQYALAPTWMIQQPYFVHKAHYLYNPGSSYFRYSYAGQLNSDAKVIPDKKHGFTLDVADVPPLPDEDYMPPLNLLKWHIVFFYSDFTSASAFWVDAANRWGNSLKEAIDTTPPLRKIAQEIVSPGDSDRTKTEKIYAAVMNLENTDFSREKSKAERKKEKIKNVEKIEDYWTQKSGGSDALALLFVALCRAVNLSVWPMKVVDRSRAIFDENFLNTYQLEDYIAVADLDGKQVFLDPGEKMCPFGSLHWKHTLTNGFLLSAIGGVMAKTPVPNYTSSILSRTAVLTVDATGSVKGSARFVMSGPSALKWRQLTLENDPEEVKKLFDESFHDNFPQGVQASFDHFLALEDYKVNLIAVVNVTGSLGSTTGKHLFLPGLFFESGSKHPFVTEDKRLTPIDMRYAELDNDDVTYYLPPGYSVESMPQNTGAQWENRAALKIASSAHDTVAQITRSLAYNFVVLGPRDYPDLHAFYRKVAAADQQQLVLTRAPTAKGN
jgi:hypothetical protein